MLYRSMDTCMASLRCVLSCVCSGWMTVRTSCHRLGIHGGGASYARVKYEYVGDRVFQMNDHTTCRETYDCRYRCIVCTSDACHDSTYKRIPCHSSDTEIQSRWL